MITHNAHMLNRLLQFYLRHLLYKQHDVVHLTFSNKTPLLGELVFRKNGYYYMDFL